MEWVIRLDWMGGLSGWLIRVLCRWREGWVEWLDGVRLWRSQKRWNK